MVGKLLTLLIWLRYPGMPSQYRWFIRIRCIALLKQVKYFIPDYIKRKPYKEITFNGEFQQELIFAIPFAYWHYKNGTLKKTVSSRYTRDLYFFSPNHEERFSVRDYTGNFNPEIPCAPHDIKIGTVKWKAVPFKEHFRNDLIASEKPLLIIANRYNTEWNQEPISYFDIPLLDQLFKDLNQKYQIIYNRPGTEFIINDNSKVKELGDYEWIQKNYPEVIQLSDLYRQHEGSANSFNHFQLMMYANCENFISVHGGTATLASYFGGKNVIFSMRGHEHYMREFQNIFPRLSGARIFHAVDKTSLIKLVREVYLGI